MNTDNIAHLVVDDESRKTFPGLQPAHEEVWFLKKDDEFYGAGMIVAAAFKDGTFVVYEEYDDLFPDDIVPEESAHELFKPITEEERIEAAEKAKTHHPCEGSFQSKNKTKLIGHK